MANKEKLPASPEVEALALVAQSQKAELAAIEEADKLYGDGQPYERIRLENEVRFYQNEAGSALLEMGKRLILLREHEKGNFVKVLENLGMAYRSAAYAMAAARKFANVPTLAHLQTPKLKALSVLDDDEIDTLENGGTVKAAILHLAAFGVRYNKEQEIIPVWENKSPEESPQSVVKLVPPSEIRTGFYKVFIAEYHKSVN